jgi:indole-3-glycerol phosphate synthase
VTVSATHRDAWVAEKRAASPVLALAEIAPSRRDFLQFVTTHRRGIALVARIQRCNPATGGRWPNLDVAAFARAVDESNAGALAVRTAGVFGGALADLDAVVATATAPVLRDDLCLTRDHVYESRLHGADAVVLPTAELMSMELRELAEIAASTHMAAVFEVRTRAELDAASALSPAVIGLACVTADGWADLAAIVDLAARIAPLRSVLLLAEVRTPAELRPLDGWIDAAVVGDALLDTPDPQSAIDAFLAASA